MSPAEATRLTHDERNRFDLQLADVLGAKVPLVRVWLFTDRAETISTLSSARRLTADGTVVVVFDVFFGPFDVRSSRFLVRRSSSSRSYCSTFFRLLKFVFL